MRFVRIGHRVINLDYVHAGRLAGGTSFVVPAADAAALLAALAPAPAPEGLILRFGIVAADPDRLDVEELARLVDRRSALLARLGTPRLVCRRGYHRAVRELLAVQARLDRPGRA